MIRDTKEIEQDKINEKLSYEAIDVINSMNDDEYNDALSKAVDYWCSLSDVREGLKHALLLTINDQLFNHADDLDTEQLQKLLTILKN